MQKTIFPKPVVLAATVFAAGILLSGCTQKATPQPITPATAPKEIPMDDDGELFKVSEAPKQGTTKPSGTVAAPEDADLEKELDGLMLQEETFE